MVLETVYEILIKIVIVALIKGKEVSRFFSSCVEDSFIRDIDDKFYP